MRTFNINKFTWFFSLRQNDDVSSVKINLTKFSHTFQPKTSNFGYCKENLSYHFILRRRLHLKIGDLWMLMSSRFSIFLKSPSIQPVTLLPFSQNLGCVHQHLWMGHRSTALKYTSWCKDDTKSLLSTKDGSKLSPSFVTVHLNFCILQDFCKNIHAYRLKIKFY